MSTDWHHVFEPSPADIMETKIYSILAYMDQEEVAFVFRQYGLVSTLVVYENGRLIGVIDVDDIVNVIDEQA